MTKKDNEVRERLVSLTESLIRFQSDNDHHLEREKCLDYIGGYLKSGCKSKFKADWIESQGIYSLYVYNPGPKIRKQKEILLCGHIDVISAAAKDFIPRHDSKNIYGRGSGDMKSGIAVMMELFIKHSNSKNISLLFTSDEEVGSMDGAMVCAKKLNPSVALIPEPSDGVIVIKEKGATWLDISVEGPGGHGSMPWSARNAIDVLMEIITEMRKHFLTAKKEAWVSTLSIGAIEGGSLDVRDGKIEKAAGNVIANHASVRLDLRLTEKMSHEKAYAIIDRIIAAKKRELKKGYSITRSAATRIEHMNTPMTKPEVRQMIRAYEKVFGKKPRIVGEHGASDGRFFSAKGIPTIMFGCIAKGYHATDEQADIASIVRCFEVFDGFIENYRGR